MTMADKELTIAVDCKLSVSEETAGACLKLVEMFLNSHKGFAIQDAKNDDGTVSLFLVDYNEDLLSRPFSSVEELMEDLNREDECET